MFTTTRYKVYALFNVNLEISVPDGERWRVDDSQKTRDKKRQDKARKATVQ